MEQISGNTLLNLRYIPDFSDSNYELFEIDQDILAKLTSGSSFEMTIKSYTPITEVKNNIFDDEPTKES